MTHTEADTKEGGKLPHIHTTFALIFSFLFSLSFFFPFSSLFFAFLSFLEDPPLCRFAENEENKYFSFLSFLSFLEDPPLDELGKMKKIYSTPKYLKYLKNLNYSILFIFLVGLCNF